MPGLYIGSTSGYSGKNTIAAGIGLWLKEQGLNVGYMKPVGANPVVSRGRKGDADAFFVQSVLGIQDDPADVTPALITPGFLDKAMSNACPSDPGDIAESYRRLAQDRDVMVLGGSGSLYTGRYCGLDGIRVVTELAPEGVRALIVDRARHEFNHDSIMVAKEKLGDALAGVIFNAVSPALIGEGRDLIFPFLERNDIPVLGAIPYEPDLAGIRIGELAEELEAKEISEGGDMDRIVDDFLIGAMQVENFLHHFRKRAHPVIIVGGDRADIHLAAVNGGCAGLILTGQLYPNDAVITRCEAQGVPILLAKADTYTVASQVESILATHKNRDPKKAECCARSLAQRLDMKRLRSLIGV
jgi:BioD-like phosphotransacetylase family protein